MSVINEIAIPESLLRQVRQLAEREGISIEQFIVSATAEKASAWLTVDYLKEKAKKGSREEFEKILAKVPKTAPDEWDQLD
jgi:hypothetical protein